MLITCVRRHSTGPTAVWPVVRQHGRQADRQPRRRTARQEPRASRPPTERWLGDVSSARRAGGRSSVQLRSILYPPPPTMPEQIGLCVYGDGQTDSSCSCLRSPLFLPGSVPTGGRAKRPPQRISSAVASAGSPRQDEPGLSSRRTSGPFPSNQFVARRRRRQCPVALSFRATEDGRRGLPFPPKVHRRRCTRRSCARSTRFEAARPAARQTTTVNGLTSFLFSCSDRTPSLPAAQNPPHGHRAMSTLASLLAQSKALTPGAFDPSPRAGSSKGTANAGLPALHLGLEQVEEQSRRLVGKKGRWAEDGEEGRA